jgi:putative ABC transport system ATP-binding protein
MEPQRRLSRASFTMETSSSSAIVLRSIIPRTAAETREAAFASISEAEEAAGARIRMANMETGLTASSVTNAGIASDAVILIERVSKIYQTGDIQVHALRSLSLTIHRGEFVAIMGPSGSGKSTLMNIIGCLDRPTKGQYLLDGVDVSTMGRASLADIRNQRVGFVFQSFNLVPRTSALENVELPMLYAGVPTSERHKRARAALADVNLADRERNMPNQLSGGQQQRVALARALVNNPSIILADEPTGALDTRTSVEVMEIFQRLNRERQLTIIIVTHEADIALYAQRVIHVRDGRIHSDEPVTNRYDAAQVLRNMPSVDESDKDEDEK